MTEGEGAFWDGDVTNKDGVTYEVEVTSSPITGAVRIPIAATDTPFSIARNIAAEWNVRQPIEDVVAVADETEPLTAFFLTGQWEEEEHHITSMAATFDGKSRETMCHVNDFVESAKNPRLTVTRVDVGCTTVMKAASMPQEQVAASAKKTQSLPEKTVV